MASSSRRINRGYDPFDDPNDDEVVASFEELTSQTTKRARGKSADFGVNSMHKMLKQEKAIAVISYMGDDPNLEASDIWPHCRSVAKMPARYTLLDRSTTVDPSEAPQKQSLAKPPDELPNAAATLLEDCDGRAGASAEARARATSKNRTEWKLPVELVELIAQYLNRDDIKSLRLVSRELNYFVSQVIFETVVVPFNTEIYGMLGSEPMLARKGKRRAKVNHPGYCWKNAGGDEVYNGHGLDVFRGFGKHILRFGMSFEVNEDSLATPPKKTLTERKTSFWGEYDWPYEEYRRFDTVAGLELAADETPRMKIAFSELTKVKELALSIDNGLGWLNGPDRSIRSRVLHKLPRVFGSKADMSDRRTEAHRALWTYLESLHKEFPDVGGITQAMLYRVDGPKTSSDLEEFTTKAKQQPKLPYMDTRLIHDAIPHEAAGIAMPAIFDTNTMNRLVTTPPTANSGALFTAPILPSDTRQIMGPIIPANLTRSQREWLLETDWAQRAFLSSYMLSVVDNHTTFRFVHTLSIPRVSSCHLPLLNRRDFWQALPALKSLTLMVTPTWRAMNKDEAGFVDEATADPTLALEPFCTLLNEQVAPRSHIQSLTIGWTTGGEHAEGLHARNKLLFPAPIWSSGMQSDHNDIRRSPMFVAQSSATLSACMQKFPHVERLTLSNCWLTPHAMRSFVKVHDSCALQHLMLDSVSLTATLRLTHPNAPLAANAQGMPPVGAGALGNAFNLQAGALVLPVPQGQVANQTYQMQLLQAFAGTLQLQLQQLAANATHPAQQGQIQALQNALNNHVPPPTPGANPPIQGVNQANGQVAMQQNQQVQPNPMVIMQIAAQIQQQLQQAAVNGQAAPAQVPTQPAVDARLALQAQPREGSWMHTIDIISPGTNLADFGSQYSVAEKNRHTSLKAIQFISCGYAKLPNTPFDQSAVEFVLGANAANDRKTVLEKRAALLENIMQASKWATLGEIVQKVDPNELAALDAGWSLKTGWEDDEAARAATFDNVLPGGTGRFSGIVQSSDKVARSTTSSSQQGSASPRTE